MTTSSSHCIRKPSGCSTDNTRDISILEVNRTELSIQEYSQLDCTSPLKDLDNDGEKIPYFDFVNKQMMTHIDSKTSINDKFYKKFKEQLNQKVKQLFKNVRKGNVENTLQIIKSYPIPITIKGSHYFKNTLLHDSIKYNHLQISLLLLKMDNALLGEVNNQGRTPVHYALMYMKDLFLSILKNYIGDIDWSVLDQNKIGYYQYVQFYNYNSQICKTIKQEVSKASSKINIQKPIISFVFKRPVTQIPKQTSLQSHRAMKSQFVERSKRISAMFQLNRNSITNEKQNNFSLQTNISDFIILQEIGQGCFAKVYKVQHILTKKIYAMKVFQKIKITHQIMKYILTQKDILMRLNHPFLIKVYCSFQTPTLYCYVMDCCQGTLKDMLNTKQQMSEAWIKLITCQLISVIGYLHQNGVIYRDLKPENIGFDKQGHITLIDFGLAKDGFIGSSFCGSYLYLPPQMISSKQYNQSVDWYMLGIVIYQLFSGKTPFLATNKQALFKKIMQQSASPLLGVSLEMSDFVSQLLQKNQMQRLGSQQDNQQLMNHPWFTQIQWQSIPKRRYKIVFPNLCNDKDKHILENAQAYFQKNIQIQKQYDFIEVKRWTSVKKFH